MAAFLRTTTWRIVFVPAITLFITLIGLGLYQLVPEKVQASHGNGDLKVTINNVSNGLVSIPDRNTYVQLIPWEQTLPVKEVTVNHTASRTGIADFGSVHAGDYKVKTRHLGPWGEERWGESGKFTVISNATNPRSFTRNEPYVGEIKLKDLQTGQEWTSGTRQIDKWHQIQAIVTIWNPNADSRKVKGNIRFDRGPGSPIEFDLTSGEYTIPGQSNQMSGVIFTFNPYQIDRSGDYFAQAAAFISINNSFVLTDGWAWEKRFSAINRAPNKPVLNSPTNSDTNQLADLTLWWFTSSDPDGDPVGYAVCYGTANPPPCLASSSNTYLPIGHLEHDTNYHWQVIAVDNEGAATASDIWSFRTKLNAAPSTSLTTPPSPVEGIINLSATFIDDEDNEPKRVSWYVEGNLEATGTSLNWGFDTNRFANGDHTIKVKVFDRHDLTGEQTKVLRFDNPHASIGNLGFNPNALTISRRQSAISNATVDVTTNRAGYLQVELRSSRIISCTGKKLGGGISAFVPVKLEVPADHPAGDSNLNATVIFRPNLDSPNESCPIANSQVNDVRKDLSNAVTVTVPANIAPGKPQLLEPSNGSIAIPTSPTLNWSASIDPEGDPVGYELKWGTNCNNLDNGLSTAQTSFKLSNLAQAQNYCWQVTATDGQGGSTASDQWQFTTSVLAKITALSITPSSLNVEQSNPASFTATSTIEADRPGLYQVTLSGGSGAINATTWKTVSTGGNHDLTITIPAGQTGTIGSFSLSAMAIFRYGATSGPINDSREGDAVLDKPNAATLVVKEPPPNIIELRIADQNGQGSFNSIIKHDWPLRTILVKTNKPTDVTLEQLPFETSDRITHQYRFQEQDVIWPADDQPIKNALSIKATDGQLTTERIIEFSAFADAPDEVSHHTALALFGTTGAIGTLTERIPKDVKDELLRYLIDQADEVNQRLANIHAANPNGQVDLIKVVGRGSDSYELWGGSFPTKDKATGQRFLQGRMFIKSPNSQFHNTFVSDYREIQLHTHEDLPYTKQQWSELSPDQKKTVLNAREKWPSRGSWSLSDTRRIGFKVGSQEVPMDWIAHRDVFEKPFSDQNFAAIRQGIKGESKLVVVNQVRQFMVEALKADANIKYVPVQPINKWLNELDRNKVGIANQVRNAPKWVKVVKAASGPVFVGLVAYEAYDIVTAAEASLFEKVEGLTKLGATATAGFYGCSAAVGYVLGSTGGLSAPAAGPLDEILVCAGGGTIASGLAWITTDAVWQLAIGANIINWSDIEAQLNEHLKTLRIIEDSQTKTVYEDTRLDGQVYRITKSKQAKGPEVYSFTQQGVDLTKPLLINYVLDGDDRTFEVRQGVWLRFEPAPDGKAIVSSRVGAPAGQLSKTMRFTPNQLLIGASQTKHNAMFFRNNLNKQEGYEFSVATSSLPTGVQANLGMTRTDLVPFGTLFTNLTLQTPAAIASQSVRITLNATEVNPGATHSTEVTIDIDGIPPAPPAPTNPPTQVDAPQVTIAGSKEANTALYREGQELMPLGPETSWQFTMALNEGVNTTRLTTRDLAGNESTAATLSVYRIPEVLPPVVSEISYQMALQPNRFGSRLKAILKGSKRPGNGITINGETVVQSSSGTDWQAEIDPVICQGSDCRLVRPLITNRFDLKAFKDDRSSDPVIVDYRSITEQVELTATPAGGRYVERASVSLVGSSELTIDLRRSDQGVIQIIPPPTIKVSLPIGQLTYTTNGIEPTEQSSRFTGPIELTQSTVLKFGGVKTTSTDFVTKTESYTIVPLPAKSTITAINYTMSEPPGERNTRLWAELSGSKPADTGIKINGEQVVAPAQSTTWQARVQPWRCPTGILCTLQSTPLINDQFAIVSFNADGQSQPSILRYYEIEEQLTITPTPAGGSFQDSVSVALASSSTVELKYTIDQTVSNCNLGAIGRILNLCEQANASFNNLPIYYTIDGSEPTLGSTRYANPLVFDRNTTLKFVSAPALRLVSDPKTEQYTVAIASPVIENSQLVLLPSTNVGNRIGLQVSGSKPKGQLLVNGQPLLGFDEQLNFSHTAAVRSGDRFELAIVRASQRSAITVIEVTDLVEQPSLAATINHSSDRRRATVTLAASSNVTAGWRVDTAQHTGRLDNQPLTPINYTIDGSGPTDKSPRYSQPLTILRSSTLRYAAALLAGALSADRTEIIAIAPPDAPAITNTQIEISNVTGNQIDLLVSGTKPLGRLKVGNQDLPTFDQQTAFSHRQPITTGDRLEFTVSDEGQVSNPAILTVDRIIEQASLSADPLQRQHSQPINVSLAASGRITVEITSSGNAQTLTKDNLTLQPIYYTTDGSEPSDQSNQYRQPIRIEQTATISFKAKVPSGQLSQSNAIRYEITLPPPPPQQLSVNFQTGWNMIALPDELPVSAIGQDALVWSWRNDLLSYERITDKLLPGIGYWVKVSSERSVTVVMTQQNLPQLALKNGAAMIDGRYLKDLSRLRINHNNRDYTLSEAIREDLILNRTARWDPTQNRYDLVNLDQLTNVSDASAWWIKAKQDIIIKLVDSDSPPTPPLQRVLINQTLTESNEAPPEPAQP